MVEMKSDSFDAKWIDLVPERHNRVMKSVTRERCYEKLNRRAEYCLDLRCSRFSSGARVRSGYRCSHRGEDEEITQGSCFWEFRSVNVILLGFFAWRRERRRKRVGSKSWGCCSLIAISRKLGLEKRWAGSG